MLRKIFCICFMVFMFTGTLYAQDDDSTPYMPYSIPQRIGVDPSSAQNTPPATTNTTTVTKKTATKKKTATTRKRTAPKSKQPVAPRMTSLQQGIALMQQSKYEQARPYLLKAIQEEKNNPNAWYWYGVYHERTGGYHQAQYFYTKAVTIDPAFEPLSRVVFQPTDSEKTPLWDPKRPARVYEIASSNTGGIGTVTPPGVSSFPTAMNDPEVPRVPVYTPPDPATSPLNGDSWNAGIYVPPSHNELTITDGNSAVYVPPSPQGIISTDSATYREVLNTSLYNMPAGNRAAAPTQDDIIIRADLPLYTPPTPEESIARQPQQVRPAKTPAATTERRTASVPASRTVRQPKKRTTTAKPAVTTPTPRRTTPARPTTRTVSRDARPAAPRTVPTAPTVPTPPAQTTQPTIPQRQPEPVRTVEPDTPPATPAGRSPEYMPPVGQYSPDPGTVSETPIPPVGQGGD